MLRAVVTRVTGRLPLTANPLSVTSSQLSHIDLDKSPNQRSQTIDRDLHTSSNPILAERGNQTTTTTTTQNNGISGHSSSHSGYTNGIGNGLSLLFPSSISALNGSAVLPSHEPMTPARWLASDSSATHTPHAPLSGVMQGSGMNDSKRGMASVESLEPDQSTIAAAGEAAVEAEEDPLKNAIVMEIVDLAYREDIDTAARKLHNLDAEAYTFPYGSLHAIISNLVLRPDDENWRLAIQLCRFAQGSTRPYNMMLEKLSTVTAKQDWAARRIQDVFTHLRNENEVDDGTWGRVIRSLAKMNRPDAARELLSEYTKSTSTPNPKIAASFAVGRVEAMSTRRLEAGPEYEAIKKDIVECVAGVDLRPYSDTVTGKAAMNVALFTHNLPLAKEVFHEIAATPGGLTLRNVTCGMQIASHEKDLDALIEFFAALVNAETLSKDYDPRLILNAIGHFAEELCAYAESLDDLPSHDKGAIYHWVMTTARDRVPFLFEVEKTARPAQRFLSQCVYHTTQSGRFQDAQSFLRELVQITDNHLDAQSYRNLLFGFQVAAKKRFDEQSIAYDFIQFVERLNNRHQTNFVDFVSKKKFLSRVLTTLASNNQCENLLRVIHDCKAANIKTALKRPQLVSSPTSLPGESDMNESEFNTTMKRAWDLLRAGDVDSSLDVVSTLPQTDRANVPASFFRELSRRAVQVERFDIAYEVCIMSRPRHETRMIMDHLRQVLFSIPTMNLSTEVAEQGIMQGLDVAQNYDLPMDHTLYSYILFTLGQCGSREKSMKLLGRCRVEHPEVITVDVIGRLAHGLNWYYERHAHVLQNDPAVAKEYNDTILELIHEIPELAKAESRYPPAVYARVRLALLSRTGEATSDTLRSLWAELEDMNAVVDRGCCVRTMQAMGQAGDVEGVLEYYLKGLKHDVATNEALRIDAERVYIGQLANHLSGVQSTAETVTMTRDRPELALGDINESLTIHFYTALWSAHLRAQRWDEAREAFSYVQQGLQSKSTSDDTEVLTLKGADGDANGLFPVTRHLIADTTFRALNNPKTAEDAWSLARDGLRVIRADPAYLLEFVRRRRSRQFQRILLDFAETNQLPDVTEAVEKLRD